MQLNSEQFIFIGGLVLIGIWAFFLLYPVGSGYRKTVANGDAYHHMWNLWWGYYSVYVLHQSPYTTDYNGFPETLPLYFHQLILPLGVLSAPFFLVGLTAGQVLLFWLYFLFLAGYVGMYLLIRYLGGTRWGALAAGIYLCLSPLAWQNLPRPDSLSYLLFGWLLLAVLWSRTGSLWRLLAPVGLGIYVVLISPYFGAGFILLWLLALPWYERLNLNVKRLALLVPLVLLGSSFQWLPQLFHSDLHRPVRLGIVKAFSADLSAWFLPPAALWWLPSKSAWWSRLWPATEPSLYLGWFALGVVILAWPRLGRKKYWFLAVGIIFFLIALGPALMIFGKEIIPGLLPFGWGLKIWSGLKAFRAPLRFGYFVVFFLALGLGKSLPARRLAGLAVVGLIGLELIRPPVATRPLPQFKNLRAVKKQIEAPALIPVPLTDWPSEVQYGQTIHHKKLAVEGLSYGIPPLWRRISRNPVLDALYNYRPLPGKGWSELRAEGFGGIIVHHKVFGAKKRKILNRWLKKFEQKFGSPVISGPRLMVFEF